MLSRLFRLVLITYSFDSHTSLNSLSAKSRNVVHGQAIPCHQAQQPRAEQRLDGGPRREEVFHGGTDVLQHAWAHQ